MFKSIILNENRSGDGRGSMNSEIVRVVLIVVISYLLGSIPTGYLVGRLRNVNIFEVGSGNMGATNIIRATGGIGWGALVWFFDSTKGMIAMLIAARLMPENTVTAMVLAAGGRQPGRRGRYRVGRGERENHGGDRDPARRVFPSPPRRPVGRRGAGRGAGRIRALRAVA